MELDVPTGQLIATRAQLCERGFSPRKLSALVHTGQLIRVRRGYYARAGLDRLVQQAVCVGGLLTCVSAADRMGLWVADDPAAHVHLRHEASRMRRPTNRFERLATDNRDGCTLHWWPLLRPDQVTMHSVGPVDALAHIIRCQPSMLAIASIDSALYEGLITPLELDWLLTRLPERYRALSSRVHGRAMSGIETIVRLMVLDAGLDCAIQVTFDGIGTVDLVAAGCVVIETDGRKGHDDPEGKARDYDRDAALAARGYTVLRFNYRQVMFEPGIVLPAILSAVRTHRHAGRA